MNNHERFDWLRELIAERRTVKIFGDPHAPLACPVEVQAHLESTLGAAVAAAGLAPFHLDRQVNGVAEPWRMTIVWAEACRQLARQLPEWVADWKPGNKLPHLLAGCGALVLVHWLPVGPDEITDDRRRQEVNQEHLSATSAAIQNLLLLLTAANLESYWASANLLELPLVKRRLGLVPETRLAGAIFVGAPQPHSAHLERAFGGNRQKRSPANRWSQEVRQLLE